MKSPETSPSPRPLVPLDAAAGGVPGTEARGSKVTRIELKLRELAQLFNSMDPSPFHHRDLDGDAEEYVVGWAREVPLHRELELAIYLDGSVAPALGAAEVEQAVHYYFATREEMKRREFRLLMTRGRKSLIVGLLFLAACVGAAEMITHMNDETLGQVVKESLTIGGWVAMWRPLEIYLYDWWPIRDERLNFGRLSRMRVRIEIGPGEKPARNA